MLISFLLTLLAFSHPGRTIESGENVGCHMDRKRNIMHCHGSSSGPTSKKESYSRDLFGGWIDSDSDCQDTRAEILISRSLEKVFLDKKGCNVTEGLWNDFYYDEILTKASEIDIDHVVPLKEAHERVDKKWSREQRVKFANDPENLVITNLSYNRQKGSKSPLEWLPVNKAYACKYVTRWIYIKNKYAIPLHYEVAKLKIELCK
ncbi:HNH endonuclease [Bacteriovorax sp. Seq25_V]|uniref:HNH endonuclease n=1 Tax=Bacteriovorax sp. Seq25_V TaxID=1201288 RepID=UPI00038A3B3D|nr:HNH endonuclease [Bacteriovorax sp. Seq25_V]EQC47553.1 PF07510 family protein [Bacteriovorax sp. Seq25_V]